MSLCRDWYCGTVHVERLVPPEDIEERADGHVGERHRLQRSERETINEARAQLDDEPRELNKHKELGQRIAFALVRDFGGAEHWPGDNGGVGAEIEGRVFYDRLHDMRSQPAHQPILSIHP